MGTLLGVHPIVPLKKNLTYFSIIFWSLFMFFTFFVVTSFTSSFPKMGWNPSLKLFFTCFFFRSEILPTCSMYWICAYIYHNYDKCRDQYSSPIRRIWVSLHLSSPCFCVVFSVVPFRFAPKPTSSATAPRTPPIRRSNLSGSIGNAPVEGFTWGWQRWGFGGIYQIPWELEVYHLGCITLELPSTYNNLKRKGY